MNVRDLERFAQLRADLFDEIGARLALDDHGKSYEGTFHVVFPHFFHTRAGERGESWLIKLDCYVVGPSRHYKWGGETFAQALDRCEADVRAWIAESADLRAEELEAQS